MAYGYRYIRRFYHGVTSLEAVDTEKEMARRTNDFAVLICSPVQV